MPRIIDNEDDTKRLTFTDFASSVQTRKREISANLSSPSKQTSDIETASESETSPVLYSLRNKKTVPQSSQILFLSQINDAFNSPSTSSRGSTPIIRVQGNIRAQIQDDLNTIREDTKDQIVTVEQITPESSISQSFGIIPIQVAIPAIPIPSPSEPTQSTNNLIQIIPKERKKRRKAVIDVSSSMHPLELEKHYSFLINRIRSKPLSIETIRKEYSMRDLTYLLTQNAQFFPKGSNKIRLSQILLDALTSKEITFPVIEEIKRPKLQSSQPSQYSQYSQQILHTQSVSILPFKQRQTVIPAAPSVETLLCAEFPALFTFYREKNRNRLTWVESPSFVMSSEFPQLTTVLSRKPQEPICVENIPKSGMSKSVGNLILLTLRKRLYMFNYWSKYNEELMNFTPSQVIAIHIPSLKQQIQILNTLTSSFSSTDQSSPSLSISEAYSHAEGESHEWAEAVIRVLLTILQRCLIYTCYFHFSNDPSHEFSVPQTTWQLTSSISLLPLSLLKHYRGLEEEHDSDPREFFVPNQFFRSIPVTKQWSPTVGDIVAIQTQDASRGFDSYDLAEICSIPDPFHLRIQFINIYSPGGEKQVEKVDYRDGSIVIAPWDVYSIILSPICQSL